MYKECPICRIPMPEDRCVKCFEDYQKDLDNNLIPKVFANDKESFSFGAWRQIRLILISESKGEISHEDVMEKIQEVAKTATERTAREKAEREAERKRREEADRLHKQGRQNYPKDIY